MISEMRIYSDKSVQIHPKENIHKMMYQEKKWATTIMYGLHLVNKQDFVEQPLYLCMAFKKTEEV